MSTKPQRIQEHTATEGLDLPEGWISVRLPEICQLNPPKPPADALPATAPVSFVPMPAVDAEQGAITRAQTRPFAKVRKGYTAFADGDVIMAKITPCMENGKAAIARGLTNGLGFGSSEFHVLRSYGAVLPDYVYHFLRQESFRKTAEDEMTGSVGQKRVPAEFLEKTEIPLPPFLEQERIVQMLDQALHEISATYLRLGKAQSTLKWFRQAVLAAACSGKLTEDWRKQHSDVEPASELIETIRAKHKSRVFEAPAESPDEIPITWAWCLFGFLIGELRNGISVRPEIEPPGQPILRISSVRTGKVLLDDFRFLRVDGNFFEYRLKDDDLLFTRYNGTLDLLGVCGLVRGLGSKTLLYPDKLMRVRFNHDSVLPQYAELYFSSPAARDRMTAKAKSSAGQQGISGADVKAQLFALPPLKEQREIVRRVEALFELADTIESRIVAATHRAENLKQAILAKAFLGELVPTEAELARREGRDYEPASVLLERIRCEREKARGVKARKK